MQVKQALHDTKGDVAATRDTMLCCVMLCSVLCCVVLCCVVLCCVVFCLSMFYFVVLCWTMVCSTLLTHYLQVLYCHLGLRSLPLGAIAGCLLHFPGFGPFLAAFMINLFGRQSAFTMCTWMWALCAIFLVSIAATLERDEQRLQNRLAKLVEA